MPAMRRTRKSIGSQADARRSTDRDNATLDLGAASRKKSRSKSIGPGGLDALKQGNGNRRAVRFQTCSMYKLLLTYNLLELGGAS